VEDKYEIDIDETIENMCVIWKNAKKRGFFNDEKFGWIDKIMEEICKDKRALLFFKDVLNSKISEDDERIKEELFYTGYRDLEASEMLYEKGYYEMSVYHLQQSTEKLSKYWAMEMFKLSSADIYKMKHRSPEAHLKAMEKMLNKYLYNIGHIYEDIPPDLGDEPKKMLKEVRKIKQKLNKAKKDEKFLNPSYEDIDYLIKMMDEIKGMISKLENTIEEKYRKKIEEFFIMLYERELNEEEISMVINIFISFASMIAATTNLFIISAITFPHEASSRYADKKYLLSPSLYKPGMPLVDRLPKLIEETKWIWEQFQNIPDISEEIRKIDCKIRGINP